MQTAKRKQLEAKGWKTGSAADFLGLTDEEATYIELKLKLGNSLKNARVKRNITQQDLAKRIKSSQSRVVKMEKGHPSVSIDLLIKSLLVLGVTDKEIAKAITSTRVI